MGAAGAVLLIVGLVSQQALLQGAGAAGLCMSCRNLITRRKKAGAPEVEPAPPARSSKPEPARRQPVKREDPPHEDDADCSEDLVEQMIEDRRYALLLRPETACQLEREEHIRAIRALDDDMVLTPAGMVLVGLAAERETLGHEATSSLMKAGEECLATVEACYLDRYTVTNADFQRFVDAGGYEEIQYWPEEALPALFDFVDETGIAAPRYWREGAYAEGDDDLPVVGVSWYEALAYARWVGKRLPNDAEWTKACAWPIEAAPGRVAQRRYPWGESFDTRRANLWSAGHGRPVAVDAYPEGATVGGVEQMVGNVWEWTASTLDESTPQGVRFPSALRTIRGGAFNTYFENQATCHFQSAEHPLSRRDNIGIRLAISMNVLASVSPQA